MACERLKKERGSGGGGISVGEVYRCEYTRVYRCTYLELWFIKCCAVTLFLCAVRKKLKASSSEAKGMMYSAGTMTPWGVSTMLSLGRAAAAAAAEPFLEWRGVRNGEVLVR